MNSMLLCSGLSMITSDDKTTDTGEPYHMTTKTKHKYGVCMMRYINQHRRSYDNVTGK